MFSAIYSFYNRPVSISRWMMHWEPFPAILWTCRLIHREAFEIFYGENVFNMSFTHPYSILSNRLIHDAIRNVFFDVRLNDPSPNLRRANFINLIHEFGSPTIVGGTLHIIFRVAPYCNYLINWIARGVPRFTNFRTVLLEFSSSSEHSLAKSLCPEFRDRYQSTLTPIFGPALSCADRCHLEFHPRAYLKSLPPEVDIDWMDYLDGIRLNWIHDPPSNAD